MLKIFLRLRYSTDLFWFTNRLIYVRIVLIICDCFKKHLLLFIQPLAKDDAEETMSSVRTVWHQTPLELWVFLPTPIGISRCTQGAWHWDLCAKLEIVSYGGLDAGSGGIHQCDVGVPVFVFLSFNIGLLKTLIMKICIFCCNGCLGFLVRVLC